MKPTHHLVILTIGFPINKYLSVSSGLLPYSSVGYNLDYDTLYPDLKNVVSISSSSNGGLSEYFVGTVQSNFITQYL